MGWIVQSIRENPELAIFLTLAIGFVLGRIRIGSFRLGNVVGTLLAGVLVGQLAVEIHPLVKVVFFDLFLFATGYKVGPQFFRGLRKNALSQAVLTVVLCVVSLVTTVIAAKVMGYDMGIAAGLLAGAFTESTVIGTAGNAIANLCHSRGREDPVDEQHSRRLRRQLPGRHELRGLVSLQPRAAPDARQPQGREPQARGAGRDRRRQGELHPLGLSRVGRARLPHPRRLREPLGRRRWRVRSRRRASS